MLSSLTIDEITKKYVKTFSLKFLMVIFIILAPSAFVSLFYLTTSNLNSTIDSLESQISSSIQMGDYITTERFSKSISENKYALSIKTFDYSNNLISDYTPIKNKNTLFVFNLERRLTSNSGNLIGNIQVKYAILNAEIIFFLSFFIILSFIIYLGNFIILRNFIKIISKPIQQIPLYLENSNLEREFSIKEIEIVFKKILEITNKEIELNLLINKNKNVEVIANLASQVSHDIRSPLAALNMALKDVNQIPETHKLIIKSAVNRINDIANQLLDKGKRVNLAIGDGSLDEENQKLEPTLLPPIIESIISEKRSQFREMQLIEIESSLNDSYGLFAQINAGDFLRVISNLINNSVEAMPDQKGKISLSLKKINSKIVITLQDNGKGIPPHILSKLGEQGVSYGKSHSQSGSGLGIYHAKKTIENFGGQFKIDSAENKGTTISIILSECETPRWFVDKLELSQIKNIITIDDDISIHHIWQKRLNELAKDFNLFSFTSISEFKKWHLENTQIDKTIYFVDYEFINQGQNGLELILELKLEKKSILVSSRFEEESVRAQCQENHIKIIPKNMIGYVPLKVQPTAHHVDAILIDDDSLVFQMWNMFYKDKNKKLIHFYTVQEFVEKSVDYSTSTNIFIDSNLGNGTKGEEISKDIYELGFTNIYLCTGYPAASFGTIPWIKKIITKDPVVL